MASSPYLPNQSSPTVSQTGIPYGNTPFYVGWDANSRRNTPVADDLPASASGYFQRPTGETINLWITDIAASFSLAGQAAQSRMLRQFYPRSFNDVTLTISGNVPNTQEYNRLALFIREHQWLGLQYVNMGGRADQTVGFGLFDRTPGSWGANPQGVKGAHVPWQVRGYVKSMRAGAIAHEVAPAFSVDFIVAGSTWTAGQTGIWGETVVAPPTLSSFLKLINIAAKQDRLAGGGFVTNPVTGVGPSVPAQSAAQQSVTSTVVGVVNGAESAVWSALTALSQNPIF